ncbi:MAG: glycosyltransferase family 4 protein [Cyclobacteriaceae bacterium]
MRILIVGSGDPIPTFIGRRITALAKAGIDTVVALGYRQASSFPPDVKIVRYGNVGEMGVLDFLKFAGKVALRPLSFIRIVNSLEPKPVKARIKLAILYFPVSFLRGVDLVHVQWLGLVPDLYWLKEFYRSPLLASVRGSQVTVYPITRSGYAEVVANAFRLTDFVHVVGHDLIPYCLRGGTSSDRIIVNYNGVDTAKFAPRADARENKTFELITTGSLMWRKGMAFLLLMVKELFDREVPVQLNILGDGPDREALVYYCHVLKLGDAVKFKGRQNEKSVIDMLQRADVYVAASAAEGLPNSLVEAAACALPIVSFSCEGVNEIVEDAVTGFVVPFGNVRMAADCLLRLWENSSERKEMGIKGRQRVQKYFEERDRVDEMISFYQKILAS